MKGKDMILSNFLSRQTHVDRNPHDIIPVSFNIHNTLHERYYEIEMKERYLVQMCLQTESHRIKLPEVHGVKNTWDTNLLFEKQKVIPQIKKNIENKQRLGQGRAGRRHREPQQTENITTVMNKSHEILKMPMTQNVSKNRMDFPVQEQSICSKTETITQGMIQDKNRDIPFYPDLFIGLLQGCQKIYDFRN